MIIGLIILGVISSGLLILFMRETFMHAKTKDEFSLENKKYKKSLLRNEQLVTMFMSDKALHVTQLTYDETHTFYVQYEVEVLELTKTKAKIKTIDVFTDDNKMSDPKHKPSLLGYMDNKWVKLSSIEFILDGDAAKRELRLSKLLDEK